MRLISWNITKECDLACQHCYRDAGEKAKRELTTDEAKDLLAEIKKAGFNLVIFSGGEPLLRKDIYELITHTNSLGLISSLGTNGLLLDSEVAGKLKALKLSSVGISIDSIAPTYHEYLRGDKGCWQRAIDATKNCRKVELPFQIHTTLTKDNYLDIPDFVNLSSELGAAAHYFFFLVPCGRARDIEKKALVPSEHERALRLIIQATKTSKIYLRPICAPQFVRFLDADLRKSMVRLRPFDSLRPSAGSGLAPSKVEGLRSLRAVLSEVEGSNADTRRFLKEKGCLAGREYCLIGPDGEVYPCAYLPLSVGNVCKEKFSKIWKDNSVFEALRGNNLKGRCLRCEFGFYCRGCRANSFYYKNDILEDDPQCLYQPDTFLDEFDKRLINYLQEDFPLVLKPFRALADRLNLSEDEVLFRVSRLKAIGIIKRIGPIYNPEKLGFKRSLVAMSVSEEKLKETVSLVNSFREVTHNYLREDNKFNLWFTLICPTHNRINSIIRDIKVRSGIKEVISLPTTQAIKVKAVFKT